MSSIAALSGTPLTLGAPCVKVSKLDFFVQQRMFAEIVFGTPSKQCLGHGICAVFPTAGAPYNTSRSCKAVSTILFKTLSGQVGLAIPRRSLPQHILTKHFSDNYFQVEEHFCLPENILEKLQLSTGFIIRAGVYKICFIRNFILIFFC